MSNLKNSETQTSNGHLSSACSTPIVEEPHPQLTNGTGDLGSVNSVFSDEFDVKPTTNGLARLREAVFAITGALRTKLEETQKRRFSQRQSSSHLEVQRSPFVRMPSLSANEGWFQAVKRGDIEEVKSLLEQGADCNAVNKNYFDWTALHFCGMKGYRELAKFLLEKGATVNQMNPYGWTPLMAACANNNKDVYEVLVEHGADINGRQEKGWTPLIWAAYYGNDEIVKTLLDDPRLDCLNYKDGDNKTALQYAVDENFDDIVEFLKSKGGTT